MNFPFPSLRQALAQPGLPGRAALLAALLGVLAGVPVIAAAPDSGGTGGSDAPDTPPAASDTTAAGPAADGGPASESMAEHRVKELAERQRSLFADADAQGGKLDKADFRARVQMLAHDYEAFLRDSPDSAAGYAAYGYLLWRVGMRREAVGILLKADSLDPAIPLVKNELGNFLVEEGKPLEAIDYYLAAAKLEPNEPLYQFQLGRLLSDAHDEFVGRGGWTRESVDASMNEAFRRAAELAPDRYEYAYDYGMSFYAIVHPDWNRALAVWRRLEAGSQSEQDRETMLLHEANVLIRLGRASEARALLGAVTLPDNFREKKQALLAQIAGANSGEIKSGGMKSSATYNLTLPAVSAAATGAQPSSVGAGTGSGGP